MGSPKKYDYLFKIIMIGNAGVGKSCIVERYVDNTYGENYYGTIGVDFKIKTLRVDGKIIRCQIWDTAGQERFKSLVSSYYRGSHACILVYDTTNPQSLIDLASWYRDFIRYQDHGAITALVGTKIDLKDLKEMDNERIKEDIPYDFHLLTSSKDNINIEKVFEKIIYRILNSDKIDDFGYNYINYQNLDQLIRINNNNRKCC